MKNEFDDLFKEAASMQKGMMFAMLRAFWPYILGALVVSGASIAFMVWMIVELVKCLK